MIKDKSSQILDYLSYRPRRGNHPQEVFLDFDLLSKNENYIFIKSDQTNNKEIDFIECFDAKPQTSLMAFSLAIDIYSVYYLKKQETEIILRIKNYNHTPLSSISNINRNHVGKFLKIRGKIVQMQEPKLYIRHILVSCKECNSRFTHYYRDGFVQEPRKCILENCESYNFIHIRSKSECGFFQRLIIEDFSDSPLLRQDSNRIIVELRANSISTLKLDDVVEIGGLIKAELSETAQNRKELKNLGFYNFYLEMNYSKIMDLIDVDVKSRNLRKSYQMLIESMLNSSFVSAIIVKSIAPSVRGQEMAKYFSLLSMIGSAQIQYSSNTLINQPFDNNIHCLLLGSRGVGKTRILKYLEKLSPQSKIFLIPRLLFRMHKKKHG